MRAQGRLAAKKNAAQVWMMRAQRTKARDSASGFCSMALRLAS